MVTQIDVHELSAMLGRGEPVYLVDVRQPWEHERAALPGSQLIPLGELSARAGEVTPPPGEHVATYCHHGIRSLDAAVFLQGLGHRVASLSGGIDQWSLAIDRTIRRY